MKYKCGIIGLPNVGKSTLFNAMTKIKVKIDNYPFCTINPNIGIVTVPDMRLEKIKKITNYDSIFPATIKIIDVAGLIEGSSNGNGLGNQFLADIRETNILIHVVRCFNNTNICHINNAINPIEDINIINTELLLSDLQSVEKRINKLNLNKLSIIEKQTLEKAKNQLYKGLPIRMLKFDIEEQIFIDKLFLLTAKPVIYIANINKFDSKDNILLKKIIQFLDTKNNIIIPFFGCSDMDMVYHNKIKDEKQLDIYTFNIKNIVKEIYKMLRLITYFSIGNNQVHARSIKIYTTAKQAAKIIHTDFEIGFICAKVISYYDYIEYKTQLEIQKSKKIRIEGKNYIVQDGDIIHFLFRKVRK